jgi:signal transduction histidine kinase
MAFAIISTNRGLNSLAELWSRKSAQDGLKLYIQTMCKDASMSSCLHFMPESLSGWNIVSNERMENIVGSGIPRYAGGEFAGYIGSNIDITDLKRAAEESERLRQVKSELAHLNRVTTMGELAASIAHEIKQPISAAHTNAKTCLRWLGRDEPDIAEAREAVSRIVQDVTRASEIISRIRGLFKQGESERGSLDVNEVIGEMISLLRGEAGRHAISVHAELAPELPKVSADRVQLQQVLMNLMLNGIEAISEGKAEGQLTIRSQRNPEDLVLISVSDTGIGLPPDRAEKVFDAFFTTKPQGTGMGLSLSRSIIEAHGGRLWATGNPDRGATFQFTLPAELALTAQA